MKSDISRPDPLYSEKRIELFIEKIKEKLAEVNIDVIDTKESGGDESQAS
jgi:uncharacterized protein YfkK (UPF0435 family)